MITTALAPYTHDALTYFAEQVLRPTIMKVPEEGGEPVAVPVEMSPAQMQDSIQRVAAWIAKMPGRVMRDHYIEELYKAHKPLLKRKSTLSTEVQEVMSRHEANKTGTVIENEREVQRFLPKGLTVRDVHRNNGWFQVADGEGRTGIYFLQGGEKEPQRVAEFTIDPVFHKVDREDNCRIIKIDDGYTGEQIIEMPSAAMISADSFRKYLFDRGSYFFEGTQTHLNKIIMTIKNKFPKAWELKELGWQEEGFFAYYNAVYNGSLKDYNEAGLVEHDGRHYYSAAISQAFSEDRKGNDLFENDRYLVYEVPPISFKRWGELVKLAYPDHYYSIILGAMLGLHRDIHFKIDNNCPHLYFFGESGSGKSKAMETVSNIFFKQLPAFTLSSGTDNAFSQRLRRYKNTVVVLNEFDGDSIKPERRDAIKTAYDGEGRERGIGTSRHKTETQKVNSLLGLVGQFLYVGDDGSIPNRSIIEKFTSTTSRTKKQVEAYEELKLLEKKGLAGILTEVLTYRKVVEVDYYATFHHIMHAFSAKLRAEKGAYQERILRNYSALPTLAKVLGQHIDFPFTYQEVEDWAYSRIIDISNLVSQTDVLLKFWTVLETLVTEKMLKPGRHYKIENSVTVRVTDKGKDRTLSLAEPTDLLYIRLRPCQQLYMKFARSTGEKALDSTSLESYLRDRDYCIGRVDSERFVEKEYAVEGGEYTKKKTGNYSAWIIDMKRAGIDNSGFTSEMEWEQKEDHGQEAQPDPFPTIPDTKDETFF